VLETLDAEERIEVQYMAVKSPDAYAAVMREQQQLKPKLLLLDRNQKADTVFEASYIERLMTDVSCAVMVVRLGGTDGTNTNVLVPAAGGSHSRRALKMIHKSANINPTAFFVEPDADEVSLDVGYKRLGKIVNGAGIALDEMKLKAVIAQNISKAIVDEVAAGDYGMLLLGATDGSKLKRKLFGTISANLLEERDGTAVAVIRAERPVRRRIKDTFEKALSLTIPQLSREERVALFTEVEDKSRWSFDFAALMVLATAIAALGLLADSGAVVIGAMLVAPLMTPLLGAGLSLVQGNWPLWKQCQKSVLLGFVCALVVGVLCGGVAKVFGIHLTGELIAGWCGNCCGISATYCDYRYLLYDWRNAGGERSCDVIWYQRSGNHTRCCDALLLSCYSWYSA